MKTKTFLTYFSVLVIALVSSISMACSLADAEKAFDMIDQTIFQSLSGAEAIGYGEARDGNEGMVYIGMTSQEEVDRANSVFRDGLVVNGCAVSIEAWSK